MPSIAIVGADPQPRPGRRPHRFGSHGFGTALIFRNRDELDDLAGELTAEGTSRPLTSPST
ncbi:hypothetical protein ACF1G5_36225 [Streptomyces coeruleorubidus]|uniref:hypothetical protein n=1 Tax=Streptomyces coeruleorubidus TaxID=116188 RepID=UPI0036F6E41E